jgi:SSS family solute:Na+ symporter
MDIVATGLGLIDYAIFFITLVMVLAVGFRAGGKIKSLADYAVSREKKFSMPVLAMTLIVTAIGSNSSIGAIAEIYNEGIIYTVTGLLWVMGTFLLIQHAMKFMAGRYAGQLSLYGIIEDEYGVMPAKFAASISVFLSLIYLSMQIIGMGYIAKTFLGVPFIWGASISTFVFVAYSSIGGIRGVVYTDVLQFFIVLIVFPLLLGLLIYKVGGLNPVFTQLPVEKTQILDHPNFKEYVYLTLFWVLPFGLLRAEFIQRFLMCSTGKELKQIGVSYMVFDIVFLLIVSVIALASITLLGSALPGKEVIPTLMQEYFPIGFKGLAIAAFFAVIMSTADSHLNAATVLFAELIMTKEVREKRDRRNLEIAMGINIEENEDDRKQVLSIRLFSAVLGFFALLLALSDFSFIKVATIASAIAFGAVNIPIFFAPFKNKKVKTINAYKGSLIGSFGSFLLLLVLLGQERVYMISFYSVFFTVAGWFIGAKFFDKSTTTFWKSYKQAYVVETKLFKQLEPPVSYVYFVIFCFVTLLMRYTLYPWELFSAGNGVLSSVFILSCVFLLTLSFGDKIKGKSNVLFIILWIGTMFLSLPFYNMLAFLQHGGDLVDLVGLVVSLFLMSLIFDWLLLLLLLGLSFVLVSVLNIFIFQQEGFFSTVDHTFLAIYVIMAGILVSMFLKKMWETTSKEKLEYAYTMAGSVAHELQTPIMEVGGWLEFIPPNSLDKNSITQDKLDEIKKVLLSIRGSYNNSVDTIRRTMQVFTMGRQGRDVVDTDLNMAELVADAVKTVRIEDSKRDRIRISISPDLVVHAYANNLITILHNLIRNAAMYSLSKDKKATIRIYNEGRDVIVYDDGVGIRSDRILTIFDRGTSYDSKRGSGFGLYYCKIEMERIGGRIRCYSREGEFTKFVLSFPEVRAKKAHKNRPVKRNRR